MPKRIPPRGSKIELEQIAREIAPLYGETLRTLTARNSHKTAWQARRHFYAVAYATDHFSWDAIATFCGNRRGENAMRCARALTSAVTA